VNGNYAVNEKFERYPESLEKFQEKLIEKGYVKTSDAPPFRPCCGKGFRYYRDGGRTYECLACKARRPLTSIGEKLREDNPDDREYLCNIMVRTYERRGDGYFD